MSTLKSFFKDTIIYGFAAVLPRVITIVLLKLKTNVFGTATFSIDVSYYVYAAYLNALLTYGMETAFFRFFTKEKEKGKVISTTFISLLVTVLLFLMVGLFYVEPLSNFFGFEQVIHLKILLFTIVFDTLVVIPYAYLRVNNRPIRFAYFKISNVIISALLVILFLWVIPQYQLKLPNFLINNFAKSSQSVIYVFLSGLIASAITFILMLPIIFKFKFTFDKILLKRLLAYGLPIMVLSLAFVTNENLDKLLLKKYISESEMGIYAACYKLGVFMTIFVMAFRLGAEPFFFNQADKANAKESYATILTWFTIIGAIFMFVIIAYIKLFANLIIDPKFFAALDIVPIILLANLFLGIYANLSIWYKLTDKTKYGMYISVFGAVLTILLNLVFIKVYGYRASAWATLFVYATMTFISYYLGKKHYPVPYQLKKVALYLGISTLFSYISFVYFQEKYIISTFLLLFLLGIVWYFEKENLKKIIN